MSVRSLPTYRPVRFPVRNFFGVPLHAVQWDDVLKLIDEWMGSDSPHQISVVNAHSIVMARDDGHFLKAIEKSDLILPDSVPIVKISRALGQPLPSRVAGPDFCEAVCALAEEKGYSVFFLGSTPDILSRIQARLSNKFPRLKIAGIYSPPWRKEFSQQDSQDMIDAVNRASPDILWVGLTAPKQEKWIHENLRKLHCKMAAGIGAAFDFIAGTRRRAPYWIQALGFEWLYRFSQEPRRLWRRYIVSNGVFLALATKEFVRVRAAKLLKPVFMGFLRKYLSIARPSFFLDGKDYPYFWHDYNMTWRNERCVEIAVARKMVEQYRDKRILELGNVLSHYFAPTHDIVDKYEEGLGVVNADILDFYPSVPYDFIVSLSTIEHIGWDEEPRDPEKVWAAICHLLEHCLAPSGQMLVTFPYGYNPVLDEKIKNKILKFSQVLFMKRLGKFCHWKEVPFELISTSRYNYPFPFANGLVVGLLTKESAGSVS